MNKHLPNISIEKYAAYLDGNLSDEEMQQIDTYIENDSEMQEFMARDEITNAISDLDLFDKECTSCESDLSSIELPSLDTELTSEQKRFVDKIFSLESDRIEEETGLYEQNTSNSMKMNHSTKIKSSLSAVAACSATKLVYMYNHGSFKFHRPAAAAAANYSESIHDNPEIGFAQAETTHGKPEMNVEFDPATYQYYSDSCAFQSQAIVLKEYGINVSQEELMEVAKMQGWYVEGHGTPLDKVGKLLEHYDVPTSFTEGNNVFNLTNELAQGHRVIVTVDSGELWHKGFFQNMKDVIIGDTPNHALVVVGMDTRDPNDVKVIVTDPGNGNLQKAYSEKQFVDAWKDSNCFMAATEVSPEEFIDHLPPTHMEQFAGIPYPTLERLADTGFDSGMERFSAFVADILEQPNDVNVILDEYQDLIHDNDDGSFIEDNDNELI